MNPKVFLIHDSLRGDRYKLFKKELEVQGIESWTLVAANKETTYPAINIARAHKSCIRRALAEDLPQCLILEDDVKFVAPGAYNRFLEVSRRMSSLTDFKEVECDILISGSYEYQKAEDEAMLGDFAIHLRRFSGLFCYIVNKKSYQKMLEIPERGNYDKELSKIGLNIWMCWPMLCLQHNTRSDHTGKTLNFDEIYKDRIKLWTNET